MSSYQVDSPPHVLPLDFISDITCPWCAIGYHRLEQAIEKSGIIVQVRWHPYEINPHLDCDGINLIRNIGTKYAMPKADVLTMRATLTALGADVGFRFNYTDEMMVQNSMRAHQLVHWAGKYGKSHRVKLALFEAFFTHRQNVADIDMLASLAGRFGLDEVEARQMLESKSELTAVRDDQARWARGGVEGVPALVAHNKYLLIGAQSVDYLRQWLEQMAAKLP